MVCMMVESIDCQALQAVLRRLAAWFVAALPAWRLQVAGVIPRAIAQIFSKLDTEDSEYTVKCSFLELYNEETTDLLAVGDAGKAAQQKLRIMEDRSGRFCRTCSALLLLLQLPQSQHSIACEPAEIEQL